MKLPNKKILIGLLALVLVGTTFIVAGRHKAGSTPTAVYYCPMHPTYTSDRPGDCPICNMKLVKKEEAPSPEAENPTAAHKGHDICYLHKCPHMKDGKPCPMLVVGKEGEKVDCPICKKHIAAGDGAPKEKKILYWTDPMLPGYKSDNPGKSPMGMDLVPVYEEQQPQATGASAPEGYAPILLTAQKQQLIGIRTAIVVKKKLEKTIRTVGTVAHDPELYQAQTEYIQAVQAFERSKQSSIPEIVEQSQRLLESTRIRLKHMGLSDELIAEIATWKEPDHSLLFAHFGEPVWIYSQIYEYELPLIKVGQEMVAEVPSLPGQKFSGKIRALDPMVQMETRTTRLRAQVEDSQGQLRPDMYMNVTIQIDLGEHLAVPAEAVFDTGKEKIVFVDKGQGLLEPRNVVLGAKTESDYEVQQGVQEGENVVTSGNFLIDSESRLKAAMGGTPGEPAMMTAPGTQEPSVTPESPAPHQGHGGH